MLEEYTTSRGVGELTHDELDAVDQQLTALPRRVHFRVKHIILTRLLTSSTAPLQEYDPPALSENGILHYTALPFPESAEDTRKVIPVNRRIDPLDLARPFMPANRRRRRFRNLLLQACRFDGSRGRIVLRV